MGDKRNFAALDWVLGEILDTLKEARQSLEAFVEDPKDATRIRFCLTHIHQVHGSLQMVEFHGAALLAEEMEHAAQAIMDDAVSSHSEAQEVLMRGLLQLPIFLENAKTTRDDNPARLLPLLNDMRAVRKQSYLSETNLFSPDLSSLGRIEGSRHALLDDEAKLRDVVRKLRDMYQFAAASVLRNLKVDENLTYLEKVFARLEIISRGTASHPLWWVASALIDALHRDEIELTVAVRGLMRYLAREMRVLSEKPQEALAHTPPAPLMKNLLFYVARAESDSEKIESVNARFNLSNAMAGREKRGDSSTTAPDAEAIRSVVVALQDEIGSVKHVLEMSLSGQSSTDDIVEVLPTVKRVGDTLAVLGIGDLRKRVLEQSEKMEAIAKGELNDENALMGVASEIIEIEHRLNAIAKTAGKHSDLSQVNERDVEIDNAKAVVIEQCSDGLLKVKDAIVEYISSQWNQDHLEPVGPLFIDIRGGLNMIPLPRAAAVADSCERYIREQLLPTDDHPDFQSLELLADAVASLEYYLERLMQDMSEESETTLQMAEESVAQLGYPAAGAPDPRDTVAVSEADDEISIEAEASPQNWLVTDTPAVAEEPEFEAADEATVEPEEQLGVSEVAEQIPSEYDVQDGEEDVTVEDEPTESESLADTLEFDAANAAEAVAEAPVMGAEITAEVSEPVETAPEPEVAEHIEEEETVESDIDDEIIEIFIEEAGEVLETLNEYYPQWRERESDQDALVVVRRAFHTLKGSGRMVEAFDIGELAWSVENMLNRVIDRSIRVEPHVYHLIDRVIEVIPTLVKAFEQRSGNPIKALTTQYEAWGHEISEGNFPDVLAEPLPPVGSESASDIPEFVSEPAPVQEEQVEEASAATGPMIPETLLEEEPEDDDVDRVLQEIFSQESDTHLDTIEDFIREMESEAPIYSVPSDALQRALHTLKGSAKMAQVWPIAEVTEPLEHLTKELIAFQVRVDDDTLQLIRDAASYTRAGVEQINAGDDVEIPQIPQFVARTQELRQLAIGHLEHGGLEQTGERKIDPRMLSIVMAEEMALLLDADELIRRLREAPENVGDDIHRLIAELKVLEEGAQQANLQEMNRLCSMMRSVHEAAAEDRLDRDEHFFSVMGGAHENLLDMVDAVAAGQNIASPDQELVAALDALVDSIRPEADLDLAEEDATQAVTEPYIEVLDGEESPGDEMPGEEVVTEGEEAGLSDDAAIAAIDGFGLSWDEDESSTETHRESQEELNEETSEALPTFEVESLDEESLDDESLSFDVEEDEEIAFDLSDWSDGGPENPGDAAQSDLETAQSDLDTAQSELEPALSEVGTSQSELDTIESDQTEEGEETSEISLELPTQDDDSDSSIASEFEEIASFAEFDDEESSITFEAEEEHGERPQFEVSVDEAGAEDLHDIELDLSVEHLTSPEESLESESTAADEADEPVAESLDIPGDTEESAASDAAVIPGLLDTLDAQSEDFDRDILEVFIEEADELVEGLDEAVHTWESNWSDLESLEEIKRVLHTLKGGARLSGLSKLGDLTHDYETRLIEMGDDLSDVDGAFFATLHGYQDQILGSVRGVKTFLANDYEYAEAAPISEVEKAPADAAELDEPAGDAGDGDIEVSAEPALEPSEGGDSVDNVLPFQLKPKTSVAAADRLSPQEFVMPSVSGGGNRPGGSAAALKRAAPQEMVKVSSELLEELVNLAGETSINRSRLEQYINDFSFSLDEVDTTLNRLQDQLRRLDIETEAQILFRQEQMEAHDEFDPLEMDRYSHLQQLSRSLIESASDLKDLKSELGEKLKVTETLLVQQSRINTTLQEGLMRSRMVPFSRMVPRLRRIVRQVASELGKNVSFELDNVEGELDRSVLERMVPPFEHMLRNAVDHGIESPEERVNKGKSEEGRIVLTLAREGGDVIIRLADDGRGVDLERVREKAVERGLISPEAELADHDVMQFILHAGFSTAEKVSQISGRGVGMDVVNAEIKQLGGSVTINSAWGKGTEFVIRLPFTLSVNRALMVAIGQDQYAVPLSSIEGIVRVSPFELEHYYANPDAQFEYAGENYQVRYLGGLLTAGDTATLEGHVLPLPVLLVRSAEHTMAVQVDAVMGSREIVVKTPGVQFSTVAGLSGATVMGDGSVVVILDPHALVRQEIARASYQLIDEQPIELQAEAHHEEDRIKTVMVVDDSVTVRKVTTRFLEREGFNVVTAKDGMDAIRLLQDTVPDLMLLDIEMPRMDGFEVAKTVRTTQRWEEIPIIMITSRTGDKHREHALSLGVNNYLGKPYQEDILLEAIGDILNA